MPRLYKSHLGLDPTLVHPLSEKWDFHSSDLRSEISSPEILSYIQAWAKLANSKGSSLSEEASLETPEDHKPYKSFPSEFSIHRFSISSQLHQIPSSILSPILFSSEVNTTLNYIRFLSKELHEAHQNAAFLELELSRLREELSEARRTSWLQNNVKSRKSFDYAMFCGPNSGRSSLDHFSANKSMERRMGLLSNMIEASMINDAPCSKILTTDGIKLDSNQENISSFETPLPNYDSDESSEDSHSNFFTGIPELGLTPKKVSVPAVAAPTPKQHPRPFHFRAIALASKLMFSSTPSDTSLNPNSKRASKRITDWTLGLLKGTKVDRTDNSNPKPLFEKFETPAGTYTPSEYEMDTHTPIKAVGLTRPALVPSLFAEPVPPESENIRFEDLSPVTELSDPLSAQPQDETDCVEMTPISSGRHHSRSNSLIPLPPSFSTNSLHCSSKEGDVLILPQSSCTSPTIGISALTTQGCPSATSTLPTVSKLLSKIIDSHGSPSKLTVEERWSLFMDAHAPKILEPPDNPFNPTASSNPCLFPHPLAQSPSLKVNFETPLEFGVLDAPREKLVLKRMSHEEYREFRRLARAGIPLPFRAKVWYECSGAADMFEAGYFHGLVMETQGKSPLPFKEQIELDLHRTMPNNNYFSRNGPGIAKLRRVLLAYSIHNPNVGYCQSMNLIAATLLLTLSSEEDAFWTLACIIERILPSDYFTSDLLVSQADQCVLGDYVADFLPKLTSHFNLLEVDLGAITFNWFLTLYSDCTSFHVLLRIWDVLLVEGAATLFRFALAMLELNEKEILSRQTSSAVYSYLKNLPLDAGRQLDKVTKLAFCVYKSRVAYDKVKLRRQKHLASLRAQFYF
ncbi:hypothetical protein DSO57_1022404 [Entomophthora muscae]|uniref:Uncharacterized protein n=1 Tax=Entomophthora muscae TaxID=34485 RepID=A0ACC2RI37_9FUNG|nr:hypothetical protein DSO57_1022404 [Entomophthora muscae]